MKALAPSLAGRLGVVFEYALSSTWSMKAEYQHFDFGTENVLLLEMREFGFRFDHNPTLDMVKLVSTITLVKATRP